MYDIYNISVTEDIIEPVTLADVKEYLHVDFPDDDTVITGMIKSARETIEKVTSIALVDKDITLVLETGKAAEKIMLPYGNAVDLVIADEDEDVLTADDHYKLRGNILSLYNTGLYTLSYSVAATVPQALKEAVMLEIKERFETKDTAEVASKGVSEAALSKAELYGVRWL